MKPSLDPLVPVDEFPLAQTCTYINAANVTPMYRPGAAAITEWYRDVAEHGSNHFDEEAEATVFDELHRQAARLFNASPADIAAGSSTTELLSSLAWAVMPGAETNVVSTDVSFPASVYPWRRVASHTGCEIRLAHAQGDTVDSAPRQGPRGRQYGRGGPVPRGVPQRPALGPRRLRGHRTPPRRPAGRGCHAVGRSGAHRRARHGRGRRGRRCVQVAVRPFRSRRHVPRAAPGHTTRARPGGLQKPEGHLGHPHRSARLPGGRVQVRVQHDGIRAGRRVREIDRVPRGHGYRPDLRPQPGAGPTISSTACPKSVPRLPPPGTPTSVRPSSPPASPAAEWPTWRSI